MNEYRRIYVPLSKEEFVTLQGIASNEYRHPRDQARYLLRQALGLTEAKSQPMHNRAGQGSEATPSAVAS